MGPTEQPRVTPAPKSVAPPVHESGGSLAPAIRDAAKSVFADSLLEKRPYLKFAFGNPYNLSLFFGALAAAGLTLNPFLALFAVGLESLWLLHAPESKRLRHILWDPRFEKLRAALLEQERAARMQVLGQRERDRVSELVARQRDIRRLAGQNPSFTGDLLRGELVKTDRLVEAFIDMAVTCSRYEEYLASVDLDGLERERGRWERQARAGQEGDATVDIARRNLAVLLKRLDKMKEIQAYLTVARGQLDLIENSFQLIADQIVTMQSPQELSGQLDDLLDSVESIKEAAADTERMLNTLGLDAT